MNLREWAKKYPDVAASVYGCAVEDLDAVIEDPRNNPCDVSPEYVTAAEMNAAIIAALSAEGEA